MFQLAHSSVKQTALANLELLKDVVAFKDRFYRCPWAKYADAKPGTFRLTPTQKGASELESDYQGMQPMFFSKPPSWREITVALMELESEINGLQQ